MKLKSKIVDVAKFRVYCDIATSVCDIIEDVVVIIMIMFALICSVVHGSATKINISFHFRHIHFGCQILSQAFFQPKRRRCHTDITLYMPYVVIFVSSSYS